MLRIGEFATLSHTSIKTLRFYQSAALFRPAHIDPDTGYRYYSADQVLELGQILHLKALGFSLQEIREVMKGDPDRLRAVLLEKRDEVVGRIRDERVRLAGLNGWLDRVGGGEKPSHVVTLKRIGSQRIASIRKSVGRYADAVDLFEELRRHVRHEGAAAGPPAAIWHTCGESGRAIDCEAYVPVRPRAAINRRLEVYELPAGTWASVIHAGDSATCVRAYAAARSWIAANGFEVAGPKRELYWRGGLDRDRASDLTEIQFPIAIRR